MPAEPVLHVDAERAFGGGEVQVFLLMEGLAARGWRQALACPPGSAAEARARALGFDVFPVPMRSDLDLGAVGRLRRAIAASGARIAHLHTGRATWFGGLAAHRAGIRAVTTRRMDRPVRRNIRNRLVYRRLVDRAVGISPAVSRLLLDGGVPEARIRTIWSVVDPRRIVATAPRDALRRARGVEDRTLVILATASLVHRKGLDVLLDACAALPPSRDVRVWIAGRGPEAGALQARAAALGLNGRIAWLGQVDAVGDLLAACDVVAMPSRAEGLGVAVLEAMAAGRPVVASRVGGLAEAVVDGGTGLLVPPDDVAALTAALLGLVDDPAQRAALGDGGRARVAELFVPERMVDGYEALYRELLTTS